MRRITFTADDDLAEDLLREAKRKRKALSEVIRERLRAERPSSAPRRFRFIGMFKSDDGWSADRLDEYLAENWTRDIMRHRDQ